MKVEKSTLMQFLDDYSGKLKHSLIKRVEKNGSKQLIKLCIKEEGPEVPLPVMCGVCISFGRVDKLHQCQIHEKDGWLLQRQQQS